MTNSTSLKLHLHQKDGQCFQVPMRCTVAEAVETIREVFGDGPYTKAELYKGERLVETIRRIRHQRRGKRASISGCRSRDRKAH